MTIWFLIFRRRTPKKGQDTSKEELREIFSLPDRKSYNKAIVISKLWYWNRDNKNNKKIHTEKDSHIYGNIVQQSKHWTSVGKERAESCLRQCYPYQELANYSLQAKASKTPASVNKVLLDTAMPIHLHSVLGCFHTTKAMLSSCNRDHETWKA